MDRWIAILVFSAGSNRWGLSQGLASLACEVKPTAWYPCGRE
ncbi:hypothetical protein [Campylobacter concisus]|nr:hypothetical protein [Campylobacter concisus]